MTRYPFLQLNVGTSGSIISANDVGNSSKEAAIRVRVGVGVGVSVSVSVRVIAEALAVELALAVSVTVLPSALVAANTVDIVGLVVVLEPPAGASVRGADIPGHVPLLHLGRLLITVRICLLPLGLVLIPSHLRKYTGEPKAAEAAEAAVRVRVRVGVEVGVEVLSVPLIESEPAKAVSKVVRVGVGVAVKIHVRVSAKASKASEATVTIPKAVPKPVESAAEPTEPAKAVSKTEAIPEAVEVGVEVGVVIDVLVDVLVLVPEVALLERALVALEAAEAEAVAETEVGVLVGVGVLVDVLVLVSAETALLEGIELNSGRLASGSYGPCADGTGNGEENTTGVVGAVANVVATEGANVGIGIGICVGVDVGVHAVRVGVSTDVERRGNILNPGRDGHARDGEEEGGESGDLDEYHLRNVSNVSSM